MRFFTLLDISLKIKKNECLNDDELKKDLEND